MDEEAGAVGAHDAVLDDLTVRGALEALNEAAALAAEQEDAA